METTEWFDDDGFLHLKEHPSIDSTINAPLFTGTYICLKFSLNELTVDDISRFLFAISHLYKDGTWRTHSKSTKDRFAHDNFTGVICGLVCCRKFLQAKKHDYKEVQKWIDRIPAFHSNADHPRDFIYYNRIKSPVLFHVLYCAFIVHVGALLGWAQLHPYVAVPILFFVGLLQFAPEVSMIVSCYQTFKVRKEVKIIKTDGKILALVRLIATPMPLTGYICNRLIEKKVHKLDSGYTFKWSSWWYVFNEYYKLGHHPNMLLVRRYVESR
jgi:hypothetical protein